MGHNNMVSDYPKSTGMPRVDSLSTRPPGFGVSVTPQNPGCPLITCQPAKYSWMSSNPKQLMIIGKSLLCKGSSTQGTKPVPTIYNDHTGSTCE